MSTLVHLLAIFMFVTSNALAEAPTPAAPALLKSPPVPPEAWFVYGTLVVVFLAALYAVNIIQKAIAKNTNYSLADALSEPVDLPLVENNVQQKKQDGTVITVPTMRASSSRLIAFMGSISILFLFVGFGIFAMYWFATGQEPLYLKDVASFMTTGLTLFAPYLVNKFASVFGTPSKS